MSHEIRTPMNAILGFCEILEGSVTDPKHKKYIASIRSSGRALLLLINDILDLSKIEAGKLRVERKPFNPLKVFAEMERVFEKAMADKKLSFDLEISRNFPESIALDEVRLRQILLNLIGNAVKFTEKGRVRLTASCSPSGEGVGSITLAVEDTGIGVAPGEMEKIFEPFEQPAGQDQLKYGGTGLGLSITKRLVSAMSGSIKAWSEPGRGSVFTVEFRGVEIQALSPRTARESESAGPAVRFDRAVVLVADDIPSNREMICELLSGCGDLQFILAADGAEAVELAARAAPDIILMDIKMPKVDGIEAAESIKTNDKTKHIPIVAVTASVCKSTVKMKVLNSLFNACLFKPVSRQMLIGEMKKYLPHSVVDGKDGKSSGAGPAAESFDPREIKDPAGFAESLERKIVRQLDYAGKTMLMDKISALAEPLAEIGEKHSFQPFAAFAEEIKRQTDMFDVSALSDTLGRLAETIAKIQKERGGTVRK
jgi:two-component system sensor histidine kinase EvgS